MIIRGPILNPREDGSVEFIPDGALASDERGRIEFILPWAQLGAGVTAEQSVGMLMPAMFDNHIHIPQHPIRGRFAEGIGAHPPQGRLLASLDRNVFPAEARFADIEYARTVIDQFEQDTLSHGVIGGAAYVSVHSAPARLALEMLPATWSLGPVLMNMNCPPYLRTDDAAWESELRALARDFRRRVIVTDRFAVAVDSPLRARAVHIARELDLRMQTHLNEQFAEKELVEQRLYPDAGSYTEVYQRDGLLDCQPILAHCVRMSREEFARITDHRGACIAHCPTSNALLGSGVMPLDLVQEAGIDWSICTDVGASPTTSLLCEMAQFLHVHVGASANASPQQALFRTTLAAARILGVDRDFGSFAPGKSMSFIDVRCNLKAFADLSADQVIRERILEMPAESADLRSAIDRLRASGLDAGESLSCIEKNVSETIDRLDRKVLRVVVDGQQRWRRGTDLE